MKVSELWSLYKDTGLWKIHPLNLPKPTWQQMLLFSIVDQDFWVEVSFWLAKATGLIPWSGTDCNNTAPIVLSLLPTSITYGLLKSTICNGSMVAWQSRVFRSTKGLFSLIAPWNFIWNFLSSQIRQRLSDFCKIFYIVSKIRQKSNQPSDLSFSLWDFHIPHRSHSVWVGFPFTGANDMTNVFSMTLSKFTFLGLM